MRQVVRVREVKADLLHFELSEQVNKVVFFIAERVLRRCKKRHQLYLADLVETVLLELCDSLSLRDHDDVETLEKANESHDGVGFGHPPNHPVLVLQLSHELVHLARTKCLCALLHDVFQLDAPS